MQPQERKRVVRKIGPKVPEKPERALYCLTLKNPIRKICIDIVEWKYPFNKFLFQIFISYDNLKIFDPNIP